MSPPPTARKLTPTPIDVMVFGPARSGTTLVCDLLTQPGRSVVISEPEPFKAWSRGTAGRVHKLAKLVGADVGEAPPDPAAFGNSYARYMATALAPKLSALGFWGIKNVDFSGWQRLLAAFPPRHTLLCVRDLRDLVISGIDRIHRLGIAFRGQGKYRDEAWVLAGLAYNIQELMQLRQREPIVLRYEDLSRDPTLADRLARQVGLDAASGARANLEAGGMRRSWEVEKHDGKISAASVGRFAEEPPGPVRALAERLWRLFPDYSAAFGYERPGSQISLAGHPFAIPPSGSITIDYSATERWDWPGPKIFEPSFAVRRARRLAGKNIGPRRKILDLAPGTPALANHRPAGQKIYHADNVARSAALRVAALQAGDLPSTEGCDLIVALGLLEYIADLPKFFRALAASGLPALVSYHPTDDTAGLDRLGFGWVSHLSRADFEAAAREAGLDVTVRWAMDRRQGLARLRPPGQRASRPAAGAKPRPLPKRKVKD